MLLFGIVENVQGDDITLSDASLRDGLISRLIFMKKAINLDRLEPVKNVTVKAVADDGLPIYGYRREKAYLGI